MDSPQTFCRKARRRQRARVASSANEDRWIIDRMSRELLDRWTDGQRNDKRSLIIGSGENLISPPLRSRGVKLIIADPGRKNSDIQCDEEFLPFAPSSFDAVFAVGTLDSVNDLPGALTLIRRALRRNGIFLGAFLGAGSLSLLKEIVSPGQPDVARTHPKIDVRAAGDLLIRAGFSSSVADMEVVVARYSSLDRLICDVRANGAANSLKQRFPVQRQVLNDWDGDFHERTDESGKAAEEFSIVYLTGFAAK